LGLGIFLIPAGRNLSEVGSTAQIGMEQDLMKKIITGLCFVVGISLFICPVIEAQQQPKYYLRIAHRQWPMIFEDNDYPDSLKQTIIHDIQRIHERYRTYIVHERTIPKIYLRLVVNGYKPQIKKLIDFKRNSNYRIRPDIFWKKTFGHITSIDGVDTIIIPNGIVDHYIQTIEFRNQNPEVFSQLRVFIDQFNHLNRSSKMSEAELRSLFFDKSLPRNQIPSTWIRGSIKYLKKYEIAYFSLAHECWMVDKKEIKASNMPKGTKKGSLLQNTVC